MAKKNLLMIAKIQFVEDVFAAAATIEIINPDFPICNIQRERENLRVVKERHIPNNFIYLHERKNLGQYYLFVCALRVH